MEAFSTFAVFWFGLVAVIAGSALHWLWTTHHQTKRYHANRRALYVRWQEPGLTHEEEIRRWGHYEECVRWYFAHCLGLEVKPSEIIEQLNRDHEYIKARRQASPGPAPDRG